MTGLNYLCSLLTSRLTIPLSSGEGSSVEDGLRGLELTPSSMSMKSKSSESSASCRRNYILSKIGLRKTQLHASPVIYDISNEAYLGFLDVDSNKLL